MAKVLILNPGGKKAKRKKNVSKKAKHPKIKAKKLKKTKKHHKWIKKAKAHSPKVKKNTKKGAIMAKRKHKRSKKNPYRATKAIATFSKVKGKMYRAKQNPIGGLATLSAFNPRLRHFGMKRHNPVLLNPKKRGRHGKRRSWLMRNPAVGAIAKHVVHPFTMDSLYNVLGLSIGTFGTLAIQAAVPVAFLKKGVGSYLGNIVSAIALASATKAVTKKEDMAKMVLYGGLSVVVIRAIAAVVNRAPATNVFAANIKESLTMAGLDDVGATEEELKAAIEAQVARELTGLGQDEGEEEETVSGRTELPYETVGARELPYETVGELGETELPYETVGARELPYETVGENDGDIAESTM